MRKSINLFLLMIIVFNSVGLGNVVYGRFSILRLTFLDPKAKAIYPSMGGYEGEIGLFINSYFCLWAQYGKANGKGQMTYTRDDTKLEATAQMAGLRIRLSKKKIIPYLIFGYGKRNFQESNVVSNNKVNIWTGLAGLGFSLEYLKPFIIDAGISFYISLEDRANSEIPLDSFKLSISGGFAF